jgi:hypothetical protein
VAGKLAGNEEPQSTVSVLLSDSVLSRNYASVMLN